MKLINYSAASKMLTNDRTNIRSTYNGKKYAEAINELKEFEKNWINKYAKQHIAKQKQIRNLAIHFST